MTPCTLIIHGDALACACNTWVAMGQGHAMAVAYLAHMRYRSTVANPPSPQVQGSATPESGGGGFGAAGVPSLPDASPAPAAPPN